jgi:alkanesulfonate monooxygenase SsuD/methylene tetrahydromethanopterin reductase-like flavin-dependent oxidoreductase (luciferase family)
MSCVRVGLSMPLSHGTDANPADVVAALARLDASPLDSLWVLDQLVGRTATPNPVALLGFAAAATRRVRLGTAVYVAPARNPVVAAKELATLQSLSGGRLVVGVGSGDRGLFPSFGLGTTTPGTVLEEFVGSLRRLWTESDVRHDGPLWPLPGVTVTPRPDPAPLLWLSGGAPVALRRAVRHGDGWIGAGRYSSAEFIALVDGLRLACADADRDPAGFAVAKRVYLHLGSEPGAVDAWFGRFYGRPELGRKVTVSGTPEACADQLNSLVEAGATDLVLHPVAATAEQDDLLFEELLPRLAPLLRSSQHPTLR